ncbi:SPOR domain-containing protein [Inhella sp.]|uniref:SPOR domain-containing protein n=1 Tax=Inhella sp. TaxID=1921806 RepID=UPI0035B03657
MSNGKQGGGEKGGFVLGMVVGLLLGLAIALGVALYVAKVPIPFIDKVPQRTAAEDEADAQAHKNWNPNAKLPGGTVPSRAPAASGMVAAPPAAAPAPAATTAASAVPPPAVTAAAKPASAAASAAAGTHVFFVQAGAFTQASDAEQQRAKLAMQGLNAKVYERASGDRSVYRVRIGPFDDRAAADALLDQVKAAGMEAVMVRTQR